MHGHASGMAMHFFLRDWSAEANDVDECWHFGVFLLALREIYKP